MKLIITGGAGFIGSNFIIYMLKKYDYKIICLDKLTYAGNLENLSSVLKNKNFEFIRGDIANKLFIRNLFKDQKPDMIINFAAESHVDRSIKRPNIFLRTNVMGVNVLMDAALEFNIKRFHQVSTDEVYGDLSLEQKNLCFKENNNIKPSSPYSASKAAADLLALAYYRTFGLKITVSRCSNNYGPFQFPEKLIPLVIINAINNKNIPVYGTGENIRDWLHVYDHCRAIDLILHTGKPGEIYNIGANNEKSNLELIKIILRYLNKPESLVSFVKDRPGHDLRYAVNANKIFKELNWQPEKNFDLEIKNIINWYVKNESWWKNILNGQYKNYYKAYFL